MAKTELFQNKLYFHIPFTAGASVDKAPCSVGYSTTVKSSDDTKGIDYDYGEDGVGGRATKFIRQSDAGYKYSGFRTKKRWYPRYYYGHTFCFWYKYSDTDIVSTSGSHCIYDVNFTSLSLRFNSNNRIELWGEELEPNKWYHIAATTEDGLWSEDGGDWEWKTVYNMYINGKFVYGYKGSVLYGDTDEIYLLGKGVSESVSATPKYTYWITDFRWYSTKLSSDEVYQMAGNPLLAHFPLNKPAISGRGDSRPCFYSYAHTYYNTYDMSLMPLRYTTDPNSFSYYSPPLVTNNILYKNKYDKSAKMVSGSYKYMFSSHNWTVNPDTEGAAVSFWYLKTGYGCLVKFYTGHTDDSQNCSVICGFNANNELQVTEFYVNEEGSFESSPRTTIAPSGLGSDKNFSHMVISYKNGNYYFYNNGTFIGVYTCLGSKSYPEDQLVFGNARVWAGIYPTQIGEQWQGNFSDIKMYRRALTEEEIKILYNQDTRLEMSPKYSWHAGEIREISEEEVWIQPGVNRISAHSWIEKMPANGTKYANGVLYGGIIECKDFYEE